MSALDIAEICEKLPPQKREEVADFARFLLSREQDIRWEDIIGTTAPRPRLEEFLQTSKADCDQTFDLERL